MVLLQEINRIKEIMFLFEDKGEGIGKSNLFKDFDLDQFKNEPPPKDNSKKTKEELEFISKIELDKRFVQSRDDIGANFFDFLDSKDIDYNKKLLKKIKDDSVEVIQTLKKHYKRPRPFKLDNELKDPMLKSTKGYSYPSGHSTQSNLLKLILTHLYPKYKKDFDKITKDIVFSRQMAKAHYPSDIKFGEKLAKKLFVYLKDNDLIH
jgi:hypothetical protein